MGSNSSYKLFIAGLLIILTTSMAFGFDVEEGLSNRMREVYIDAHKLYKKGEYTKSVERMQWYLGISGERHGLAELLIGNAYLKLNKKQEALNHYVASAELFENYGEMWSTASSIAYELGKYEEAEKYLKKAESNTGQGDEQYRMSAHLYSKLDKFAMAIGSLEKIKNKSEQDSKFLLYLYSKENNVTKAKGLLGKLLKDKDGNKWWRTYGLYMMNVNNKESAAALKMYLKTGDVSIDDKRVIAGMFGRMKVYDEAYRLYLSLGDTSKSCNDIMNQSRMAYKLKEHESAEASLKIAISKSCGDDAYKLLAYSYLMNQRFEDAAKYFASLAEKSSDYSYMTAVAFYRGGDMKSAKHWLSKSYSNKKLRRRAKKLRKYIEANYER